MATAVTRPASLTVTAFSSELVYVTLLRSVTGLPFSVISGTSWCVLWNSSVGSLSASERELTSKFMETLSRTVTETSSSME